MDNGGLRYSAMESALRPAVIHRHSNSRGDPNPSPLDQPGQAKHHPIDPRKQTPGGRHQIGIPAGFKSESVAGFLLQLPNPPEMIRLPTLADAILDRVIHNAYRIDLAGESLRKRPSSS